MLTGEQGAAASHADRDLVGDQMHAIACAQFAGGTQVGGVVHGHARRALDQRLDDQRGDLRVVLLQMLVERLRATQRKGFGVLVLAGIAPVRAGYGGVLPDQRAVGIAEQRHVGHRQRAQRLAVVAVLQAEELGLVRLPVIAPVVRAHLQRDLGGRGTVRSVETMA